MSSVPRIRSRPLLEEIEARILYSADLAGVVVAGTPAVPVVEQRTLADGGEFVRVVAHAAVDAPALASQSHEVVFIDASVPDAQSLIEDIGRQQSPQRRVEIVLVAHDADGMALISDTLAERHDITAVHILGHGRDGEVALGSARLDFDSLLQNATRITRWGEALTQDADILVYGCDVAQTQAGCSLIDALARLTGADVSASENATGSQRAGGDWSLEYRTGAVATPVIVSAAEQDLWDGLLDEPVSPSATPATVGIRVAAATAAGASAIAAPAAVLARATRRWIFWRTATATLSGSPTETRYSALETAIRVRSFASMWWARTRRPPPAASSCWKRKAII